MALGNTPDNRGFRRVSGGWGTLYMDGVEIFECTEVSAEIEVQRSDVLVGNNVDSKITGLAGSGSFTLGHVYTRHINNALTKLKEGHDPRFTMSIVLDDPDAVGGQREQIDIGNVWINNLNLAGFTRGEIVEKEYEFGFTPDDADIAEGIY